MGFERRYKGERTMNKHPQIIPIRTRETIDSDAADWLVKLDAGRLSAEERGALRKWLSKDPENAACLQEYAAIWGEMDIVLNDLPGAPQFESGGFFSSFLTTRWAFIAAVSVFLCSAGLSVWIYFTADRQNISEIAYHATEVGTQHVEKFTDGSTAHLNTDSIIEAQFSDSSRIVRLLRGEAMFDVVRDPTRPFIVYAGNRQLKVIGTKFVVRLTSENIVVTVTDGQVQLTKRQRTGSSASFSNMNKKEQEIIFLSEGEEIELGNQVEAPKIKELSDDEMERRFSWLSGQLVFRNEKLQQVIEEISRYVPAQIIIDDPELKDVRISGRFTIGDTDALLEAIEVSFNVHARHTDDVIHLSPIH